MLAVFDDMAAGITLAIARGDDRPPDQRQVDLAAMGVAGHRQGDPLGHVGKQIGVVGGQNGRRFVVDLRQGAKETLAEIDPALGLGILTKDEYERLSDAEKFQLAPS